MIRHPLRSGFPLLAALALTVLGNTAGAAPRTVYTGTLQGAGEVVMELDSQPVNGVLTGRYFYPKHGVDIPLKGKPQALAEPKPYVEAMASGQGPDAPKSSTAAVWQGEIDASGYQGNWIDAKTGKVRSFVLRRVADYDTDALRPGSAQAVTNSISGGQGSGVNVNVDITEKTAPYDYLKLAGHAVPVDADSGKGPVAYRMWRDPRTQFTYPRLARHPDPQVLARINHLLEQRHWQKNLAALACMATLYTNNNPAAGTLGSYDEEAITVTWLSSALMTLTESGSLYCGGAHPDNHFEPYTFDLLRGDYLDWNRIFDAYVAGDDGWPKPSPALIALIDQARVPLKAEDADAAANTERAKPGQAAEGAGGAKAVRRDPDDTSLDGCADVWPSYLALGTDAPGVLSLSVSGVGHAMGVCLGTHATLPFAALTPYLTPDGRAYLVTQ